MSDLVVRQSNLTQKSNTFENLRQATAEIKKTCETVCKKIHACESPETLTELRCKIRSNMSILATLEAEMAENRPSPSSEKDRQDFITLKREMEQLSVRIENVSSYIETKENIECMLKEAMNNALSDIKNLSSLEDVSHLQREEEAELNRLATISVALDGLEEITKKIPNLEKKGKHPLRGRWEKIKASREKKLKTLRRITSIWMSFEEIKQTLIHWISEKEQFFLQESLNDENIDKLSTQLLNISGNISKQQQLSSELEGLFGEMIPFMNEETANEFKGMISTIKARNDDLAEKTNSKLQSLSQLANLQKEFQHKIDALNQWLMRKKEKYSETTPIPEEAVKEFLTKANVSLEELSEKLKFVEKLQLQLKNCHFEDETLSQKLQVLDRECSDLCKALQDNVNYLKYWDSIHAWNQTSINSLNELMDEAKKCQSKNDVTSIEPDLKNLLCQCQTRNLEQSDESDCHSCSQIFPIKITKNGSSVSIANYIDEVVNKVEEVQTILNDKKKAFEEHDKSIEDRWSKFRSAEKNLAGSLQEVLQNIQKITVNESTLDALKSAATAVTELSKKCVNVKTLKDEYNVLGKELITYEPSKVKTIQEATLEANTKWERISNLLTEQNTKSKCLILLWDQCVEIKQKLNHDLKLPQEALKDLHSAPASTKQAVESLERCKRAIEVVKKCRYPFEGFYKKQSQLIQELQTVPSFDVAPLKAELLEVQTNFSSIGTKLTSKLSSYESQVEIWKHLDLLFDQLENGINDLKLEVETLDVSDFEICRLKLNKLEAINTGCNAKVSEIQAKIKMLLDMNETEELPEVQNRLQELKDVLAEFLSEYQQIQEDVNSLTTDWEYLKKQINEISSSLDLAKEMLPAENDSDTSKTIWEKRKTGLEVQEKINAIENQIDTIEGELSIFKQCQDLMETVQFFRQVQKKFESTSLKCKNLLQNCEDSIFKRFKDLIESSEKEFNAETKKLHEGVQISYASPQPIETQKKDLENSLTNYMKTIDKREIDLNELHELIKSIAESSEHPSLDHINKLMSTFRTYKNEYHLLYDHCTKNIDAILKLNEKFNGSIHVLNEKLDELDKALNQKDAMKLDKKNYIEKDSIFQNVKTVTDDLEEVRNTFKEISAMSHISSIKDSLATSCQKVETVKELSQKYEWRVKIFTEENLKFNEMYNDLSLQLSKTKSGLENAKQTESFEDKTRLSEVQEFINTNLLGLLAQQITIANLKECHEKIQDISEENFLGDLNGKITTVENDLENTINSLNQHKKVLFGIELEWSSIEEAIEKCETWFAFQKPRLHTIMPNYSSIEEKHERLNELQSIDQSLEVNKSVIQNLFEKAKSIKNDEALLRINKCQENLQKIKVEITKSTEDIGDQIKAHEDYLKSLSSVKETIVRASEALEKIRSCNHFNSCGCLESLEFANQQDESVTSIIEECSVFLTEGNVSCVAELDKNVEEQMMPEGYEDEVLNLASQWENLVSEFEESANTFNIHTKLSQDFETIISELESSIQFLEGKAKIFELKASIKEKKDALAELKKDLSDVNNKLCDIDILTKTPEYVKLYEEYIDIITSYQNRLNITKDQFVENISRQEDFVKEHELFTENHSNLNDWITSKTASLKDVQSITSDLSNLQNKKEDYDSIEEEFEGKKKSFSELVEQGEGLYEHTSIDGQITIREQLNQMRTSWQQLTNSIQQSGRELDSSLQELAEFTCLQEKLTRWLREIEYAMQEHTKLRPTLEEKKGQLESHEIIHKEINSRDSLVYSVCSKAEEIMEKRGNQSLTEYVTSIRALFKSIAIKSQDLIGKI